ncbi:hypothetical protein [Nocardiopsis sp. MG754419]|uniref:hypothetical protein n=1 Tax=Nocardiopsis sp. MG754419 TaxID=2259865 RepID=UPI001BA9C60E|nr:hypothetical protein [Nocardiopsis sp. MG754419]MBR8744357.1 hypothetical protein [Nocardiopsis sp. MG754419]
METQTLVIIAILVVVAAVLVAGITFAARSSILPARRTARLKQRFGAEYDHAVETHGDTAGAEKDLAERLYQRQGIELRDLTDEERRTYADAWTTIQQHFVDDPVRAVHDARGLVESVMRDVGYPEVPTVTADDDGFERLAKVLSVDHPAAVADFRRTHAAGHLAEADQEQTENLREALVAYRRLADSLLGGLAPRNGGSGRDDGGSGGERPASTGDQPVENAAEEGR